MVALREWYFTKGGMFLSDAGRDAYFALQEELKLFSDRFDTSPSQAVVLDQVTYERLRSKCSTLRSALVCDVGTRKSSELN